MVIQNIKQYSKNKEQFKELDEELSNKVTEVKMNIQDSNSAEMKRIFGTLAEYDYFLSLLKSVDIILHS